MGKYNERRNQLHEVIRLSGMNLIIDDTDHPLIIKVASIQSARMQVYFIDNDDYFQNRLQVTDENGEEYEDNDARAIFYARGVLETVKKLRWCPDIILCPGWMTALAPLYIKKVYKDEPSFRDAKVIFSLYEDDFKQPFHADFSNKLLLKGIAKKDIAGFSKVLGRLIFQYRFSGFAGIVQYFLIDVFALLDNAVGEVSSQFAKCCVVNGFLQSCNIFLWMR